jgi:choline dehydrogenase-like flavoprotein
MTARQDRWVVVGGGVAGCVVAARLAEFGVGEVVLIEEGPVESTSSPVDIDAALAGGRRRSGIVIRRSAGCDPVPYTAAVGVGGGSAVNAMVASPGGPFTRPHRLTLHTCDADDMGPVDHVVSAVPETRPVQLTAEREHGRIRRVSVAEAYLGTASGELRLVGGTRVDRVVFDGDRAVGVVRADGAELDADRVVICAGAIGSPLVLWRSGLDLPAIGHGFSDHPSVTVELAVGDVAWGPGPTGVTVAASAAVVGGVQVMPVNSTGALVFGLLRPSVRGVVLAPTGPEATEDDPVVIEHHVADHDGDVNRLAEVIDRVLAGVDARPRQPWTDTSAMVREHLVSRPPAYTHAASTCAIGSVTDAVGAVRGRQGVYVVDASVFPTVPAVNPMLPTVQLAETLLGRWRATGVVPTP